ncbi:MAG: hypothetical protein H7318_06085 [Oligoflexus sp.]|nr:hypothetical protein [Oligoflexus sp.]
MMLWKKCLFAAVFFGLGYYAKDFLRGTVAGLKESSAKNSKASEATHHTQK